jgi:superoxide dismutase, Cu-Zn family
VRMMVIVGALLGSGVLVVTTADAQTARADIKTAEGKTVGEATLEQKGDGVHIAATFTGLPSGTRAFHIHGVGKCEPPFESAGGHFNPTGKQHGKENPRGAHAGDLPNLEVGATGQVRFEAVVKDVTLDAGKTGLLDADGAALVVHEGGDDHKSDPAGNAGKRIACGVVRR